ncbi:MAG: hypothetical protein RLZZ31_886 [Actinomycetota bacterium]
MSVPVPRSAWVTSTRQNDHVGEIVVITGAELPLGRRLVRAALTAEGIDRVVAVGSRPDPRGLTAKLETNAELVVAPFKLDDSRLVPYLHDATKVVLAGARSGLDIDGSGGSDIDLGATRLFLSSLTSVARVAQLVVISSALVYGVRATNPVPLRESDPVRPDPEIQGAVERAELERICRNWASGHGAHCAIMRPTVVVGPENGKWLARSPWSTTGLQTSDEHTPVQFVHIDDVVSATLVACQSRIDGALNVAPDGWITVKQVRELKGPTARVRLARPFAHLIARLGERFGFALGHPDTVVATSESWVVANEKLRDLGWQAEYSHEEAYVESDRGGPWARLTPRHRQNIALGVAGVFAVATAGTVAYFVRRHLRKPK